MRDYNVTSAGVCDESNADELFCETAGRLEAEAIKAAKQHGKKFRRRG
jgi:hypothetical protein